MYLDLDLEAGGEAEIAPPDQDRDQPMDYQPAGSLAEGAGLSEAVARPNEAVIFVEQLNH